MRSTCTIHLIPLDLIVLMTCVERLQVMELLIWQPLLLRLRAR
jgi:hypothetical protein